jgi:hypothetical protein
MERIAYGLEKQDFWVADPEIEPCGDCGVTFGELHKAKCDQEQCPSCAYQLLSCGCFEEDDIPF